jgi:hypothetical protein
VLLLPPVAAAFQRAFLSIPSLVASFFSVAAASSSPPAFVIATAPHQDESDDVGGSQALVLAYIAAYSRHSILPPPSLSHSTGLLPPPRSAIAGAGRLNQGALLTPWLPALSRSLLFDNSWDLLLKEYVLI